MTTTGADSEDGRPPATVAELLGRCLRAAGATRLFGSSASGISGVPGLGHLRVDEPELAALLADAAGRIGTGPGVALLPGRRVRLSSAPGAEAGVLTVTDPASLPVVVAGWTFGAVHAAVEVVLDLDLDAPVPDDVEALTFDEAAAGQLYSLDPSLASLGILVLAGPGVVRGGQVAALQDFAARAGVGVVNTWGAKGVFPWDSPHHFGTAGLQDRDFELAGFGEAGLVVAVGVDPLEAPPERWAGGQVLEVEPWQLSALAFRWAEPAEVPPVPPLYRELAAAVGPLYELDSVPISPARAARDLAGALPDGGVVAADPGPAGLWVARTFPTTVPGSVVVPATVAPGFAAAAGIAASLDGRPSLSVTAGPLDPASEVLVEQARAWGAALSLLVWGDDGVLAHAADHAELVGALAGSLGTEVVPVPVDLGLTRVLEDVAGPVVAWSGG
ncbi:MAG: hypothetical protein U0Q07_15480 [Acidimicrobiales bacterium]